MSPPCARRSSDVMSPAGPIPDMARLDVPRPQYRTCRRGETERHHGNPGVERSVELVVEQGVGVADLDHAGPVGARHILVRQSAREIRTRMGIEMTTGERCAELVFGLARRFTGSQFLGPPVIE